MELMFRIEEIVVVSIDQLVDWPAKIIDILYYQSQMQHYDISLFHAQRVRRVVPLKCISKIDKLNTSKLSFLKNTTEKERFLKEAWVEAFKQLEIYKSKYKLPFHSTQFNQSQSQIEKQAQKGAENRLEKKGFRYYQYKFPTVTTDQLEKRAKTLREKTLDLKFKNGSQFYLLKGVLEFRQLFLAISSKTDRCELARVVGVIEDAIKILLLIKKQQTEMALILTDLVKLAEIHAPR